MLTLHGSGETNTNPLSAETEGGDRLDNSLPERSFYSGDASDSARREVKDV